MCCEPGAEDGGVPDVVVIVGTVNVGVTLRVLDRIETDVVGVIVELVGIDDRCAGVCCKVGVDCC